MKKKFAGKIPVNARYKVLKVDKDLLFERFNMMVLIKIRTQMYQKNSGTY